jgi:hypothetical protein
MLRLFTGAALAVALLASAEAQTRAPVLRDPVVIPPQQAGDDDTPSPLFIERRIMDLAREALEEEQRQNRANRPSRYDVECRAVSEYRLSLWDLRITCDRNDAYGQNYYFLWIDMTEIPGFAAEDRIDRMWLAERLVDAIAETSSDPNARLILNIGTLRTGRRTSVRDITGYQIVYTH